MSLTAGLGFKLEHLDEALAASARGLWFEIHAENYMVDGGPRLEALSALGARHSISVHGVGLSLLSSSPPCTAHLARLRQLVERVRPIAVSDHLAWQRWNGAHHSDFLPFPRTREALQVASDNVARVQDLLGRPMLVENPSLYVDLPGHEFDEAAFMAELARRTGCGILLDVNNVFVSAHNLRCCPEAKIDSFPGELVGEIHLAGHSPDPDPASSLLIDSHDRSVSEDVWTLYRRLIDRIGPRPTLIERDGDVPSFQELLLERNLAHVLIEEREGEHA